MIDRRSQAMSSPGATPTLRGLGSVLVLASVAAAALVVGGVDRSSDDPEDPTSTGLVAVISDRGGRAAMAIPTARSLGSDVSATTRNAPSAGPRSSDEGRDGRLNGVRERRISLAAEALRIRGSEDRDEVLVHPGDRRWVVGDRHAVAAAGSMVDFELIRVGNRSIWIEVTGIDGVDAPEGVVFEVPFDADR